jgi:hypothetical protein
VSLLTVPPAVLPVRRPLAGRPRLPSHVTLGPYRLRVASLERSLMRDKRRHACVNVEDGRIELREDLQGLRLAEAFFECLVRLAHFSNGCQEGCIEEAYTHSFATGLVEFVHRNPDAWRWFNGLLTEHLAGDLRYDKVVRGAVSRPPQMPKRILVAGHPVTIRSIGKSECGNAFGWYDYASHEVQLYDALAGPNLAVVALHEITHAIHHLHDLQERDRHRAYWYAQVKGWMDIAACSPGAWRWLAWVISFPRRARLAPVSRRTT